MKQPDPTTIGQRIKAERERLGLTQEQVAGQLQVTRGSYCQWEERCNARLDGLFALVKLGFQIERIAPELLQKQTKDLLRNQALTALAEQAQKLDMGY